MGTKRNYNLTHEDWEAIDRWDENAADTYAVDLNGLWYKTEEGGAE